MSTSTATPDLPFGAQLIGRTEKSLDVLLKGVLVGSGLSEPEYVALRVCATHAGDRKAEVVAQLAAAFRQSDGHAADLIERLLDADLVELDGAAAVQLSPTGRELHDRLAAETNVIAERLWGDLPSDELVIAARVLGTVLRRVAAEHA